MELHNCFILIQAFEDNSSYRVFDNEDEAIACFKQYIIDYFRYTNPKSPDRMNIIVDDGDGTKLGDISISICHM